MKLGCIHKRWFGLRVIFCCDCPYGYDYAACVDFRQKHKGKKVKVEC
jgi:hypothetical protein